MDDQKSINLGEIVVPKIGSEAGAEPMAESYAGLQLRVYPPGDEQPPFELVAANVRRRGSARPSCAAACCARSTPASSDRCSRRTPTRAARTSCSPSAWSRTSGPVIAARRSNGSRLRSDHQLHSPALRTRRGADVDLRRAGPLRGFAVAAAQHDERRSHDPRRWADRVRADPRDRAAARAPSEIRIVQFQEPPPPEPPPPPPEPVMQPLAEEPPPPPPPPEPKPEPIVVAQAPPPPKPKPLPPKPEPEAAGAQARAAADAEAGARARCGARARADVEAGRAPAAAPRRPRRLRRRAPCRS